MVVKWPVEEPLAELPRVNLKLRLGKRYYELRFTDLKVE
jgi:hypothetical protein